MEISVAEDDVFKSRHFDCTVILLCVRWYLTYSISLGNLDEMMAERGISIDSASGSLTRSPRRRGSGEGSRGDAESRHILRVLSQFLAKGADVNQL
jgi:hypothetical protein